MSAEPGETAAWSDDDEATMQRYARLSYAFSSARMAREILRLRAENEALAGKIAHLLIGDHALRSQLAAATRERETPPTEPLHNVTPNPNDVL